jgi:hypothetical protein
MKEAFICFIIAIPIYGNKGRTKNYDNGNHITKLIPARFMGKQQQTHRQQKSGGKTYQIRRHRLVGKFHNSRQDRDDHPRHSQEIVNLDPEFRIPMKKRRFKKPYRLHGITVAYTPCRPQWP